MEVDFTHLGCVERCRRSVARAQLDIAAAARMRGELSQAVANRGRGRVHSTFFVPFART